MMKAPIALFVYNRPLHTKRTIESLQKNEFASESDLFIFSDGPKNEASRAQVMDVRKYLAGVNGFKSINVYERDENFGLARSIITGVTEITNKFGRVIVMEDDLISSPYFLRFMNEGLEFYENEEKVISVHGYIYPVAAKLPETFFLKGADCWGWATWKRGWDLFEADGVKLLEELRSKKLTAEFDLNGAYAYTQMLEHQISGKNNSWAIRWHASAFLKEKLTLYSGTSLIHNIGLDESGTHSGTSNEYDVELAKVPVKISKIELTQSEHALREIERYRKSCQPSAPSLMARVLNKLRKISGGLLKK